MQALGLQGTKTFSKLSSEESLSMSMMVRGHASLDGLNLGSELSKGLLQKLRKMLRSQVGKRIPWIPRLLASSNRNTFLNKEMLARLLALQIQRMAQDFHQSKLMTCNRISTSSKFCQANSMTNLQMILLTFMNHPDIAIITDARGQKDAHPVCCRCQRRCRP